MDAEAEVAFLEGDVEPLVTRTLAAHLAGASAGWSEERVSLQSNLVLEDVVAGLAALQKPIKYIGGRLVTSLRGLSPFVYGCLCFDAASLCTACSPRTCQRGY